jgi:dienelactone hydrolase
MPPMSARRRFAWHRPLAGLALAGLAVAVALWPFESLRGDAITFKDGLIFYGKVKTEGDVIIDQLSGMAVPITKANGAFVLDDGPRWLIFSHKQVQKEGTDATPDPRADFVMLRRDLTARVANNPLPKQATFKGATEFGANGHRTLTLESPDGPYRIDQNLSWLSPYFVRIDSTSYIWTTYHRTSEFDPETVRKWVLQFPEFGEKAGTPEIEKRMKLFRFLVQANWYELAGRELDRALKDLPGEKERIDSTRVALKGLQADARLDEIDQARKAGRHRWAKQALAQLSSAYGPLDDKRLTRAAQLKGDYEAETKQYELAARYLTEVIGQADGEHADFVCTALGSIRAELDHDSAGRLEAFVGAAAEAERKRTGGQPAGYNPTELAALAVSGFLMGKNAAEPRIANARQLWKAREFLIDYQRTHEVVARGKLLDASRQAGLPPFDVMAQLVTLLPPPEPGPALAPEATVGLVERQERRVDLPPCRSRTRYLLQLPPEYSPARPYPLLIVLHNAGQVARAGLEPWSKLAALNGYILAAPEWGELQGKYEYRSADHDAVLDTLRDIRQRYRVDADRVFLVGFAEGANCAIDVGLSHPDQFAGVATIGAAPRTDLTRLYWRNAQYLPFYMVIGDLSGQPARTTRQLFDNWLPRGYPSLMVVYKGRAIEWFGGELPTIMEWMNAKKRQRPFPDCGRNGGGQSDGEEFQSLRLGDNRFYWLSAEETDRRYQMADGTAKVPPLAAKLQARIAGNNIYVYTFGVKQLSVWLDRDMIDYTRPVNVNFNSGRKYWNNNNKPLTPSLDVLLEDLYQRGDQQRPYVFRLQVTAPN